MLEKLKDKGYLVLDGAMGSNLFLLGLISGDSPEAWNLEHPDRVKMVHQAFVQAGSDIILTNTFGEIGREREPRPQRGVDDLPHIPRSNTHIPSTAVLHATTTWHLIVTALRARAGHDFFFAPVVTPPTSLAMSLSPNT